MATHRELLERHRAVMPAWLGLSYASPIALVDGSGRHVVDAEGRRYLDFFGGILTTSVGYNIPEIVEKVAAQAARMVHTSTLYLIEQQIALAERIATRSGIPGAKVFFVNSGTEANEAALLLCAAHRRSNQVLALRNSYHGRSFAAMGVTGIGGWSASSLSALQVSYLHSPDRYRSPLSGLSDEEFVAFSAADLREVIATTTSGDVGCLIAEPVQGVGGFVVPPPGYFAAVKDVLEESGIPLVADEVQTAWGRTGAHCFAIADDGVVPDAITFAKGLANGLPIGGVVARPELMDSLSANSISTFGGNPLSTTAALATLDYIDEHDLLANAARCGARLVSGLSGLVGADTGVGQVRGKGLMVGVEFVTDPTTRTPDPARAMAVFEECRRLGLLVGKGGAHGNVLRVAPPLSVTEAEIDTGLELLHAALGVLEPAGRR